MIIDRLFGRIFDGVVKQIPSEDRDSAVVLLTFVLAWWCSITGLVCGLVLEPAIGLVFGLVVGVVSVLVFESVGGLGLGGICWLATGLGILIATIATGTILAAPLFYVLIGALIVALAEAFFWLDRKEPSKKSNKTWFTIKRKFLHLGESSFIVLLTLGGVHLVRRAVPMLGDFVSTYGTAILNFVGWGTLIVLIVAGYIKLNSLKYRKQNKLVKKKRRGR